MDGHASHLHMLTEAALRTGGAVFECGAGDYSTGVLHAVCDCAGRHLTTFDTDPAWLGRFRHLVRPWHEFQLVDGPDQWVSWLSAHATGREVGLCLVDSAPAESRLPIMRWAVRWCDVVVVHDTETANEPVYHLREAFAEAKYWDENQHPCGIRTTILSNKLDVKGWGNL